MLVFLFTDIEGSSRLWEEHTSEMGEVIARHDAILREAIESAGGRITKHTGDGVTAAFEHGEPIACALETQKRFAAEAWGAIGDLRIRAGLHAGEAEFQLSAGTPEGDYFGPPVNATARVMAAAWGGQVLLTPAVTDVSPLPPGASVRDLGEHLLKNVTGPQHLFQLDHPQLPWREFPPPRTLSGQSVRKAVDERGSELAALDPTGMAMGLVTAILLPTLQGELDPESGALEGNLGVLGDLGAGALRAFTAQFAGRLRARRQAGEAPSWAEIQALLGRELLAQWQAGGETAAALRADTGRLLQAVQGVEATMVTATGEIKEALARGFAELAEGFGEFRWMLVGVQDTLAQMRARQALQLALQREQLDLQREQLVKTNLLLHRQRRGPALAELTVEGEVEEPLPADVACPYMGLAAFEAQDAQFFFGREELLAELTARLAETRFLAVVGSSGSGKSSLVRAGLVPAVWDGALPGSEQWPTLVITPGAHPMEELAVRLSLMQGIEAGALLESLQARPQALHLAIRQALVDQPDGAQLLLVVDQFEEIFALCHDEDERQQFIDALLYAVTTEEGRTVVVPTIRADFYGRCGDYPQLAARMRDGLLVGPMSEQELHAAIERPARVVGLRLEPGLTDTILDDVAGEPGALPLLSHALLETFERRRGAELTLAGYAASGGVAGALAQTADTVYGGLDAGQQALARSIFLRLTELGEEGAQDTRRRVAPAELARTPEEAPAVETVLKTLADARLITTGEDTVEVAHEALVREWPTLRNWLDEDREGLRIHRHLTDAAQEWERLGREPSELYRGARLAAVAEWSEEHADELNPLERAFVRASREAAEQAAREREAARQRELEQARALAQEQEQRAEEQAAASKRLRRGALLLAGATVVAAVLAVVAFFARQQATENAGAAQAASTVAVAERAGAQTAEAQEAAQRVTAEAAQMQEAAQKATAQAAEAVAVQEREDARRQAAIGLASQAKLEMSGSEPERAVLLALAAAEDYPYTWQAEHALGEAVLNQHLLLDLPHDDFLDSIEVSPDGTRFTTMCDDMVLRVWDAETGELQLALTGHESWLWGGKWSPSGDRILSSSYDGTARVYDSSTGEELHLLSGHGGFYSAWSPDGTRISTWRETEGTVTIWDADSGEIMFALSHGVPDKRAYAIGGWSPDGSRIVTTGQDGTARVWDAWTGEELLTLTGHEATVFNGEFSPDGLRIVTGSFDGTAKVWDANTGGLQLTLAGHDSWPYPQWSPSGDRILTADDGLTIVWDASTGEQLHLLRGRPGPTQAFWSPDGTMISAGGDGGELKVWDSSNGEEILRIKVHSGDYRMGWFPDSERIYTAGDDGYAKVWKVDAARLSVNCESDCPPVPMTGWYTVPAWSPDGRQVAIGYHGGLVIAWDVATGQETFRVQYDIGDDSLMQGGLFTVQWSPDGAHIATRDGSGRIKIWAAGSGEETLTILASDPSEVTNPVALWSPEGNRIVSVSEHGAAQVWDASSGELLLSVAEQNPLSVAWSPDGTCIVTASAEGSATVWDASTGKVLLDLMPQDFAFTVSGVAWSPDGARIATFSEDRLGRIWDAQTGEELLQFSATSNIDPLVFWSPSGDRLLTSGHGGAAQVWDALTGHELLSLEMGAAVGASWSPDGSLLSVNDKLGHLQVFPAWQTLDELIDYAREHAAVRELTDAEREQFGLASQ